MNPYTARTQARIQPHDLAPPPLTGSFLAATSLAALERRRSWQAETEVAWLLKQPGVSPMAPEPCIALLRQSIGAALVRAGERLAGASQRAVAPEPVAAAGSLGSSG